MNENKQKTSRRKFLKNSTVAAASVSLGLTPLIRSVRGANEKSAGVAESAYAAG